VPAPQPSLIPACPNKTDELTFDSRHDEKEEEDCWNDEDEEDEKRNREDEEDEELYSDDQ
jgi:hypothetical protein